MENNDEQYNALHKLNEINQDMAKTQVLEAMIEGTAEAAYEHFESFNLWLLTVSGIILSFEILNADKIIGYVQLKGFFWCNVFLILSIICGLTCKYYITEIKTQIYLRQSFKETLSPIFQKYFENEEYTQQCAMRSDIKICTDLDFEEIVKDFIELSHRWGKWFISRSNKNHNSLLIKLVFNQRLCFSLQLVIFFLSLIVGILFIIYNFSQ